MKIGKRGGEGTTVSGFLLIGFMLALLIAPALVSRAVDDIKGRTLEKNYIARDFALILDAIYSVPGDLEYSYSLRSYKYAVEIRNSFVYVGKPNDVEANKGAYRYFDGLPEKEKLNVKFFPNMKSPEPVIIKITKKEGKVSVTALNTVPG